MRKLKKLSLNQKKKLSDEDRKRKNIYIYEIITIQKKIVKSFN